MLPNDIIVQCRRAKVDTNQHKPYIMLYWEDVSAAMENLKPSELKIWFYLARQINYDVPFNYKKVAEDLTLSYESVRVGFKSLQDKGYVVQRDPNHFSFYLQPHRAGV